MTNILLATPCYDERLTSSYVISTMQMKELFERSQPRVDSDMFLFSHALVAYTRNVFASRLLEQKQYSHLLMIDSDMGFNPNLILRMLELDKPICAAVYPMRRLDLDRLMTAARAMPSDTPEMRKKAIHSAYDFVAEGDLMLGGVGPARTLNIVRGFAQARAAGAGIMLIKRDVIEQMRLRFPELVAPSVPGGSTLLTKEFFQPFNDYKLPDGHVLSEDLSFCHRWTTELGGELWVNLDDHFIHHGQMKFEAAYWDKLLGMATSSNIEYGKPR